MLQWTEDLSISDNILSKSNKKNEVEHFLYYPVNSLYEVLTGSKVFCVGLVLNMLIFRCYWSVKTSTAVYIRVPAVYDILFLLCVTSLLIFIFPAHAEELGIVQFLIALLYAANAVIGYRSISDRGISLYIKKNTKKDANCKDLDCNNAEHGVGLYVGVSAAFGPASGPALFVLAVSTPLFFMQFIACLVLYVVIVWKVRASTRKVQPVQQSGMPYVMHYIHGVSFIFCHSIYTIVLHFF